MFVLQHFNQKYKMLPSYDSFPILTDQNKQSSKNFTQHQFLRLKIITLFKPISISWASVLFMGI